MQKFQWFCCGRRRRYDTFKSAQTKCDRQQQQQWKVPSEKRQEEEAEEVDYIGCDAHSTSNGGAADDLIVKYINQDIETFHLARNCQVLSGREREIQRVRQGQTERNGTQLTAVQVSSKVDNVTVGTEKQAAYWRC